MLYLKPLKQRNKLNDFGTLDIETYHYGFLLGGIYYKDKYFCFRDLSDLINHILHLKNSFNRWYVHNLAFDGVYIINELEKTGIKYDFIDSQGKLLMIKIYKNNKNRVFIKDSFSVFPMGQEKLAKMFNVKAQKYIVDFNELESKPIDEVLGEYKKRNYYDVKGLYEILRKAQEDILKEFNYDLTNSVTTAQLSLSVFRTSYLESWLENPVVEGKFRAVSLNPYEKLIRSSYAGGRVEVFDVNLHDRVLVYDVNSMYPSVMLNPMPVGNFEIKNNISENAFMYLLSKGEGFADIEFSTPYEYIPLFYHRTHGKLLFVNFKNARGVFTFPEIREGLKSGMEICKIGTVVYFPQSQILFRDFIEDIYKKRKQAKLNNDKSRSYMLKLIMNSLYGKFAQKPERDKIKLLSFDEALNYKKEVYDSGEYFYTREKQFSPRTFYMPFISAYVTAYARIKLWKYLNKADNPVYCDTDSVFCYYLPENSDELGKMKLENVYTDFQAINSKVYQSNEKKKAKGIPRKFLNGLNDLNQLYEKQVEWERLASLRKSLSVKNNVVYSDGIVKYVKMKRSFKQFYNKREVLKDGTTLPFTLKKRNLYSSHGIMLYSSE